jgi:hypothetical protein
VREGRWEGRETEPPTLGQARELKLAQLCVVIEKALPQKYSKVSGLVYFLRQVTRKSTFENVIPPLPHRSRCLPPSDCPLMYLCRVCVCVCEKECVCVCSAHAHTRTGTDTHTISMFVFVYSFNQACLQAPPGKQKKINEMDFRTLNSQPSPRYQLTYCVKYCTDLHSMFRNHNIRKNTQSQPNAHTNTDRRSW